MKRVTDEELNGFLDVIFPRKGMRCVNTFFTECLRMHARDTPKLQAMCDAQEGLHELDKWFVPLHVERNHWALAVVMPEYHLLCVYDSLAPTDAELSTISVGVHDHLRLLRRFLQVYGEHLGIPHFYRIPWLAIDCGFDFTQDDETSCGIYCMFACAFLADGARKMLYAGLHPGEKPKRLKKRLLDEVPPGSAMIHVRPKDLERKGTLFPLRNDTPVLYYDGLDVIPPELPPKLRVIPLENPFELFHSFDDASWEIRDYSSLFEFASSDPCLPETIPLSSYRGFSFYDPAYRARLAGLADSWAKYVDLPGHRPVVFLGLPDDFLVHERILLEGPLHPRLYLWANEIRERSPERQPRRTLFLVDPSWATELLPFLGMTGGFLAGSLHLAWDLGNMDRKQFKHTCARIDALYSLSVDHDVYLFSTTEELLPYVNESLCIIACPEAPGLETLREVAHFLYERPK